MLLRIRPHSLARGWLPPGLGSTPKRRAHFPRACFRRRKPAQRCEPKEDIAGRPKFFTEYCLELAAVHARSHPGGCDYSRLLVRAEQDEGIPLPFDIKKEQPPFPVVDRDGHYPRVRRPPCTLHWADQSLERLHYRPVRVDQPKRMLVPHHREFDARLKYQHESSIRRRALHILAV